MLSIPVQKNIIEFSDLREPENYFGEPIGDRPNQGTAILHSDVDKGLVMGIWQCEPGKLKLNIVKAEFVHIIAGHWVLTSDEGDVTELKAGDSAYLKDGWSGVGEIKRTVRKVFAMLV